MLYDFDIATITPNLTPNVKRVPKYLAWIKSLATPIQWAWNNLFVDWLNGSTYLLFTSYSAIHFFNVGDRVIYIDKAVYECVSGIAKGFTNPLDSNWIKINENFIGANERIKYTSQNITLEYALNNWFQNIGATKQIFISTNIISSTYFLMGYTGTYSSKMALNGQYSSSFMGLTPTYPTQINMTVNFPLALYNSLDIVPSNRDLIIRSFVDKYIVAGITYNIVNF